MRWRWIIAGGITAGVIATMHRAQDLRAALAKTGKGWNNLHPGVQERALKVLEESVPVFETSGLKVGIFEGWRDLDTQRARIADGASWVDDALNSYHPWGLAVDFVFLDRLGRWTWLPDPKNPNNKAYVDPKWYTLGTIIERAGFEWGGRWRSFDGPHAQLRVQNVAALKKNYGMPDKFIEKFA